MTHPLSRFSASQSPTHTWQSIATVYALALCGLIPHAQAQTLSEMYESSSNNNAAYQAVKANYLSVVERVKQAKAPLMPYVAATGDAVILRQDGSNPRFDRGSNDLELGLQAGMPLYNPKAKLQAKSAYQNALFQLSDLRDKEQELVMAVAKAYFDVLEAKQNLELAHKQKQAVQRQLEAAKLNFEVGTATITDSREAQASSDVLDAQIRALESELTAARSSLELRVGSTDVWVHPLATPFLAPAFEEKTLQEWLQIGREKSYAIQRGQRGVEIAKLQLEEARTGKEPRVDLYGAYTLQHQSRSANNPLGGSNRLNDARIGVKMNWPLYDGGLTQNRVSESVELLKKAEALLLDEQLNTDHKIRTAFNQVETSKARIRALESALASSKSALEAVNIGYEVGVRINIDVLNAQNLVSQTERDLAQARYGLIQSQLYLKRSAGLLKSEDLKHLDAVLDLTRKIS